MQNNFSPVQCVFILRAPGYISILVPTLVLCLTFIFVHTKDPNLLLLHALGRNFQILMFQILLFPISPTQSGPLIFTHLNLISDTNILRVPFSCLPPAAS